MSYAFDSKPSSGSYANDAEQAVNITYSDSRYTYNSAIKYVQDDAYVKDSEPSSGSYTFDIKP